MSELSTATVLEANPPVTSLPPESGRELAVAYQQWNNSLQSLCGLAQTLCSKYPQSSEVNLFAADALRAAGEFTSALTLYEELAITAPANQQVRIRQAMEQCLSDKSYFPEDFAQRLTEGVFATGENAQVWRRYARSDVQRGRRLVRMLRQYVSFQGKRVLDIGSGWGGMVIALAEEGADTVGIEYAPDRVEICRHRLADAGISVDLHQGDACDSHVQERLGQFDIIICQDVLEHVLDPEAVVSSMCAMLKEGGMVYVQVPNKWGLGQLMADHHFAMTGLTALARNQSREYWVAESGRQAEQYDVGYLRSAKWYRGAFQRHGVQIATMDCGTHPHDVLAYSGEFEQLCHRLKQPIAKAIRPELERKVRSRILNVIKIYGNACAQIEQLQKAAPQHVAAACTEVTERLCLSLWRFIGHKTAAPGQRVQ